MKLSPKILTATAAVAMSLFGVSVEAQQYSTSNPSWNTIKGNTTSGQAGLGNRDALGTRVNVPNSSIETTSTGNRTPIADSKLRWHHPFSTNDSSVGDVTRWYQKDGKTQVFRMFRDDENWATTREGAARIEAFAPGSGETVRANEGKTMTFTARYHIETHNTSKPIALFQSKALAENNFDPAWSVSIRLETDGSLNINPRNGSPIQAFSSALGRSFNLRVVDDGKDYKLFIDNVLKVHGTYDRGNNKNVFRWGLYVAGGEDGILTGSPQVLYVSGARIDVSTGDVPTP